MFRLGNPGENHRNSALYGARFELNWSTLCLSRTDKSLYILIQTSSLACYLVMKETYLRPSGISVFLYYSSKHETSPQFILCPTKFKTS